MTEERLATIKRFAEDDGHPLGSYLPELCQEIDRLRAALTARDKAIGAAEEALRLTVCDCICSITHLYGFGPKRSEGFKCPGHSCKVCAALAALAAVKESLRTDQTTKPY